MRGGDLPLTGEGAGKMVAVAEATTLRNLVDALLALQQQIGCVVEAQAQMLLLW